MLGQEMFVVFLPQIREELETDLSVPCRPVGNSAVGVQGEHDKSCEEKHYLLPSVLLTNLQSFGKPGKADKTTELEIVLEINMIDIGVFTETWATDAVLKSL